MDDMNIDEILSRIASTSANSEMGDSRYQYTPVSVEFVMQNPEQYIIPECLDCCKLLWSKGIDTYQCGNYDDPVSNGFWVEVDYDTLSDENKKIFEQMENSDSRVYFSDGLQGNHTYRMRVERVNNPNASQELCDIANNLVLQDTCLFVTDEDLLDSYKKDGGDYIVDEYGKTYQEINPDRVDATLLDALKAIEHPELYSASEGRLYKNQHALNVHRNYLEKIDKVNEDSINNNMHM